MGRTVVMSGPFHGLELIAGLVAELDAGLFEGWRATILPQFPTRLLPSMPRICVEYAPGQLRGVYVPAPAPGSRSSIINVHLARQNRRS